MKKIFLLGTSETWNHLDGTPIIYKYDLEDTDPDNYRDISNYMRDLKYDDTNDPRNLNFAMRQITSLIESNPSLNLKEDIEIHIGRVEYLDIADISNDNIEFYAKGYGTDYTGFRIVVERLSSNYKVTIIYTKIINDFSLIDTFLTLPLSFTTDTLNIYEIKYLIDISKYSKYIGVTIKNKTITESAPLINYNNRTASFSINPNQAIEDIKVVKLGYVENFYGITTETKLLKLLFKPHSIRSVTTKLTKELKFDIEFDEYVLIEGFNITDSGNSRITVKIESDNDKIEINDSKFPYLTFKKLEGITSSKFKIKIYTEDFFELKNSNNDTYNSIDGKYTLSNESLNILNTLDDSTMDVIIDYEILLDNWMYYGNGIGKSTLKPTSMFDTNKNDYLKVIYSDFPWVNPDMNINDYTEMLNQVLSNPNLQVNLGIVLQDIPSSDKLNFKNEWTLKEANIFLLLNDPRFFGMFITSPNTHYKYINNLRTPVPTISVISEYILPECTYVNIIYTSYSIQDGFSETLKLNSVPISAINYNETYINNIANYIKEYDILNYIMHNKITDLIPLGAYIDNVNRVISSIDKKQFLPTNVFIFLPQFVFGFDFNDVLEVNISKSMNDRFTLEKHDTKKFTYKIIDPLTEDVSSSNIEINLTYEHNYTYDYFGFFNSLYDNIIYDNVKLKDVLPIDIKLEYSPCVHTEGDKNSQGIKYLSEVISHSKTLPRTSNITINTAIDLKFKKIDRFASSSILSCILETVSINSFKSKRSYNLSDLFPNIYRSQRIDIPNEISVRLYEVGLETYISDSSGVIKCINTSTLHYIPELKNSIYKYMYKEITKDIYNYGKKFIGVYVDGDNVAKELTTLLTYKYSAITFDIQVDFNDYIGNLYEGLSFNLSIEFKKLYKKLSSIVVI